MDYIFEEHRNGLTLVNNNDRYKEDFNSILDALDSITDDNIIEGFYNDKENRQSIKSLSVTINRLIKERLIQRDWNSETKIFRPADYSNGAWKLDFSKGLICIEAAFNHGGDAAHNIMKTILSSEYNHVEKEYQSEIGVLITATKELKVAGNYDGAIASLDKYKSYLKPYMAYATSPLVFIGLKAPETFYIDSDSREVIMINS
tara:strand:- start:1279 stop:1887 length:609 start_codon:yes stop_codon:yes gene_type:complete